MHCDCLLHRRGNSLFPIIADNPSNREAFWEALITRKRFLKNWQHCRPRFACFTTFIHVSSAEPSTGEIACFGFSPLIDSQVVPSAYICELYDETQSPQKRLSESPYKPEHFVIGLMKLAAQFACIINNGFLCDCTQTWCVHSSLT